MVRLRANLMQFMAHVATRYNFPYKVLYLQLVVSSITIHSLLAWATCVDKNNKILTQLKQQNSDEQDSDTA